MKKIHKNRLKRTIDNQQIVNYIRQLSVVVLGIIITFVGSDIINSYVKQQEVKAVMLLIKEEMKGNQHKLMNIKENVTALDRLGKVLRQANFEYDAMPKDTLAKYWRSLNTFRSFNYGSNSMEVLKNSSLMQYVSDKTFLMSLMESYESINGLQGTIAMFYERKTKFWDSLIESASEEQMKVLTTQNIDSNYAVIFSFEEAKKYIRGIEGFFNPTAFDDFNEKLDVLISTIEEKYE